MSLQPPTTTQRNIVKKAVKGNLKVVGSVIDLFVLAPYRLPPDQRRNVQEEADEYE